MDMILQSATSAERLYICEQNKQIAEKCGSPGYLWGELDNTGTVFLHCWETFFDSNNTPEFKAEFNTVLDTINDDICATAKGYEYLCEMALRKGGASHGT